MDLSKYSKEEINDKLVDALIYVDNQKEKHNRLSEENKHLWIQLYKHLTVCKGKDDFLIKFILTTIAVVGVLACLYIYSTY